MTDWEKSRFYRTDRFVFSRPVDACHFTAVNIKKGLLIFERLKELREEPYTQAEAERAAGMGSYVPPKKVEVHTQQVEEAME